MIILGIETSCDETGVSLVRKEASGSLTILSNSLATSLTLHAKTGGIIPESAAREQLKYIIPTIQDAIKNIKNPKKEIDAIAVTVGPGLIGSLLVGVETAKTLSRIWDKPIIPVNHLYGHIYANWLSTYKENEIVFPALALVVSGGHTDLVIMQNHTAIEVIGSTRDDAAGEAFDKIGRLLNLPYPAGSMIAKLAKDGLANRFHFPRPMIGSHDFDFSFSGLKTAVLNEIKKNEWDFTNHVFEKENRQLLSDLCWAVEDTIIDVLVKKTLKAANEYNVSSILLGGGVSANEKLREKLGASVIEKLPSVNVFAPDTFLSTDNAAMIAAAAFFQTKTESFEKITADPQLYY